MTNFKTKEEESCLFCYLTYYERLLHILSQHLLHYIFPNKLDEINIYGFTDNSVVKKLKNRYTSKNWMISLRSQRRIEGRLPNDLSSLEH